VRLACGPFGQLSTGPLGDELCGAELLGHDGIIAARCNGCERIVFACWLSRATRRTWRLATGGPSSHLHTCSVH
jgi:hypothetical protein